VFDGVRAAGRTMLNEAEAKAVLAAYGIPTVRTLEVQPTADAAVTAARALGYPVALKIVSPQISHKSDVGGVVLDLRDESTLRRAADRMRARVREQRPEAELTGFSVQPMAARPQAVELIVGASVDPVFGPVLLFGHGGTAVEVMADRAIGLPPLNRVLARELISRTRVARLLAGYRDHAPAKLDAIADVLIALSQLLADWPELAELDINPLWADAEGVLALDARVLLSQPGAGRAGASHFAIAPYPAELVQRVDWQGRQITIRPIRPEDGPQHREFVEQLAPEDLRLRFFSSRRELPRSELARLTQIDYEREMAFIAELDEGDGRRRTLGVARAVCDPDNVDAEFAVIVRSDLKGRGLGRLLMDALIRHLRARGTQQMVGYVLRENSAMRELSRSLGFTAAGPAAEADVLQYVRPLAAPA
jgi:acetyltransferase